jgi:hypothetical protein
MPWRPRPGLPALWSSAACGMDVSASFPRKSNLGAMRTVRAKHIRTNTSGRDDFLRFLPVWTERSIIAGSHVDCVVEHARPFGQTLMSLDQIHSGSLCRGEHLQTLARCYQRGRAGTWSGRRRAQLSASQSLPLVAFGYGSKTRWRNARYERQ